MSKYLTDEEQRLFYDYEKMFETDGWRRLKDDMQAELEALPVSAFVNAKNYEEVVAMRVRAQVIHELLAYEDIIENRRASLELEREQASEDARISKANEGL